MCQLCVLFHRWKYFHRVVTRVHLPRGDVASGCGGDTHKAPVWAETVDLGSGLRVPVKGSRISVGGTYLDYGLRKRDLW